MHRIIFNVNLKNKNMNFKLLIIAGSLFSLVACNNQLKKLTNQVNTNLPTELKNRFYHKDFVGSYIKNPEDILGRLIYMYRINDSTIVYRTSMLSALKFLNALRVSRMFTPLAAISA